MKRRCEQCDKPLADMNPHKKCFYCLGLEEEKKKNNKNPKQTYYEKFILPNVKAPFGSQQFNSPIDRFFLRSRAIEEGWG